MSLPILLLLAFIFMVIFVGGYVFMVLGIVRADHNDIASRKQQGYNQDLIPKKIVSDEDKEESK